MDISKWAQDVFFFFCVQMQLKVYNWVCHLHVTYDPFTVQKCLSKTASKVTEERTFLPGPKSRTSQSRNGL